MYLKNEILISWLFDYRICLVLLDQNDPAFRDPGLGLVTDSWPLVYPSSYHH